MKATHIKIISRNAPEISKLRQSYEKGRCIVILEFVELIDWWSSPDL